MRSDASFNHDETGFVLQGQHAGVRCQNCHKDLKFSGSSQKCSSCHTDVHKSELGPNCQRCHTQQTWKITDMVERHQTTRFPLLGRHATLDCETCHTLAASYQYTSTSTTCYGCHRADFENSTSPNHASVGFSTNCSECHRVDSFLWMTGFDHSLTGFPLTGAHLALPCQSCHASSSTYKLVYTGCYQCHQADFAGATNPLHLGGSIGQNCQMCHTTTSWQPASFNHSTTRFPVTGAHASVACQTCHANSNYQLVYTGCYTCHTADYSGTTNPNHKTAGFPTTCETCHGTVTWSGATFNHTWFPTNHGGAAGVCASCHTNSADYSVFQCTDCHTQSQTDPRHRGVSGYVFNSKNCYQCHPRGSGGG